MNRFNIIYGFAVLAAIAAVGCAAPTDPSSDLGSNEDDLGGHAALVGDNGGVSSPTGPSVTAGVTIKRGNNEGPSPDPWTGGTNASGNPEGPSPDPWHPNARMTAPSDPGSDSSKK
jgi:hypothetical protein